LIIDYLLLIIVGQAFVYVTTIMNNQTQPTTIKEIHNNQQSNKMVATVPLRLIGQHGFAQVMQDKASGFNYLYSTEAFAPGDTVCAFSAAGVFDRPSYLTVQTGDDRHITLQPSFLQYINHSCSPNVVFDTDAMLLVCIDPIMPGDQFTFFYPSTEWVMAQPFACRCGSPNCIGQVAGASQIDRDTLSRYRLTGYIRSKL
jgi:hypothetical protein